MLFFDYFIRMASMMVTHMDIWIPITHQILFPSSLNSVSRRFSLALKSSLNSEILLSICSRIPSILATLSSRPKAFLPHDATIPNIKLTADLLPTLKGSQPSYIVLGAG